MIFSSSTYTNKPIKMVLSKITVKISHVKLDALVNKVRGRSMLALIELC